MKKAMLGVAIATLLCACLITGCTSSNSPTESIPAYANPASVTEDNSSVTGNYEAVYRNGNKSSKVIQLIFFKQFKSKTQTFGVHNTDINRREIQIRPSRLNQVCEKANRILNTI